MIEPHSLSRPKACLTTAYEWVCDGCGVSNFCSSAKLDMGQEENRAALREAMGLEPWQDIPEGHDGEWVTMPSRVTCRECGETYETEDYR